MDEVSAKNFLRSVLVQSYGSGLTEGKSGGEGNIGMIGGKPLKFNTHWTERRGEVTEAMRNSSDELRESLGNAVEAIAEKISDQDVKTRVLGNIYSLLGLDANGKKTPVEKPLLTRKVTAQIGMLLQKALEEGGNSKINLWRGVKEHAEDTGRKDTTFEMRQAEVKYENFVKYAPLHPILSAILKNVAPDKEDQAMLVESKAWDDFRNEVMEFLGVLRNARTCSSQAEIKKLVDDIAGGINDEVSKMVRAIRNENPNIKVKGFWCEVDFLDKESIPAEAASQVGEGMKRSDVFKNRNAPGDDMHL